MSVRPEDEVTEPPPIDPLTGRLADILDMLAGAVVDDNETTDAVRIDRLALLERLQAVTAALQAAESVKFAQSQVAEQLAADVHPDAIGRGIAEQIALACRISPVMAARRLNTARALWFELPDTCGQLSAGELSERVAEVVVTETRHLDPDARREVDRQLAAAGISKLGFKAAASCARKTSYEADREGYLQPGSHHARIRHIDHITRYSDGGLTTYINGRGECERGNLVREMPGWRTKLLDCGFHGGPHTIMIITPTGHHYRSPAPDTS